MDRELARRLVRIEGKINILGRAIIWTLSVVVGFAAYYVLAEDPFAAYYGIVAAFLPGIIIEWQMRGVERRLSTEADGSN